MFNNPRGKINSPKNNVIVSRRFRAEGTIENLNTGQHLFVVVEIGGLMWPKDEANVMDKIWSCEVYEDGSPPDGQFTLSLFSVGGKGYEDTKAWLERGKSTGDYPGLGTIEGSKRLNSIKLRIAS